MKGFIRKSLSVLLSVMFVVGICAAGNVLPTASAYNFDGFNAKVNDIKSRYPEGTSWTNSNSYPSGWYGCWAFANIMANEIFGTSTPRNSWRTVSISSVLPGDIITTDTWNGNNWNYGHTMFVIGVYDNTLTIAEGNYNGYIHWGRSVQRSSAYTVYHAGNYDSVINSLVVNQDPTGAVDNIEGGLNTVWVRGWAIGHDSQSKSIGIHVYIGGPAGSSSCESYSLGDTNAYRPDVSCGGNDYHGFDACIITSKTGTQPVYVYAINAQGGNNPCIGSKTVTIKSQSPSAVSEGKYFIESKIAPRKVLDVNGGSVANKTNVQLYSLGNTTNQVFSIKNEGDGFYSIRTACSDFASGLDVAGISAARGANIAQYEYIGQKNQKWKFYSSGDGYYYIMSGCGNFIDVSGGNTSDGANIATWRYEDNSNLQFKLLRAYTVSFNANGGSGAPGAKYKAQGYNLILPSTIPARNGYSFQGWATSSGALYAQYLPDTVFNQDGDITLYAVWKSNTPQTYTLTYNANGGSNPPSSQTGSGSITLSSIKPTRSGYTFLGWSTNPSATSAQYQPGASFNLTSNTTLYAVWKKNDTPSNPDNPPSASPTINIKNFTPSRTEAYRTTITFSAETVNAPTNSSVSWFVNGEEITTAAQKFTYKEARESFTIQAKLRNSSGQVIAESGIEQVNIKTGFWAKLIAFFRNLFRRLPVIVQTIEKDY